MVERLVRNEEVWGSIPHGSTRVDPPNHGQGRSPSLDVGADGLSVAGGAHIAY